MIVPWHVGTLSGNQRQGRTGIMYCVPGLPFSRGALMRGLPVFIPISCETAPARMTLWLSWPLPRLSQLAPARTGRALLRAGRFLHRSARSRAPRRHHPWPFGPCAAGPWRGARHGRYAGHHAPAGWGRGRIGQSQALAYGEALKIGDVTVRLVPAGHILGSAQVVIEYQGRRAVISGDYKRHA